MAQGAASQVSGGVQMLAGLSSLSIDPTLGGNNSDPGARIAMQKGVTNNSLFTFATDVTSTQRELIQGEYQFNMRWSTSVTRDERRLRSRRQVPQTVISPQQPNCFQIFVPSFPRFRYGFG